MHEVSWHTSQDADETHAQTSLPTFPHQFSEDYQQNICQNNPPSYKFLFYIIPITYSQKIKVGGGRFSFHPYPEQIVRFGIFELAPVS
ncbi:hypothetical protein TNCT_319111 [Trichonephila clavata]|uniref:Uncharacterized protein n=1 Tax=Trichonephila clavata TaxID=2740835 RepID=A0A8X6F3G8_TRICU|nr:hypothetical protein TNCT_319111 [Trichonephila clavata]